MRRVLALLAVVAVIAGLVWFLGGDGADPPPIDDGGGNGEIGVIPPGPRAVPFRNAKECQVCHADVYAEWEKSYHGMAWTDPMVQALSNGFRDTECIDCHAPQPIHLTGVDQRVAPRQHARQDGVDCLTCHILDDGISVAASRSVDTTGTDGACRPVETKDMSTSMVCAGCHNQHETVDELRASSLLAECQSCHMEEVDRADGRVGNSHVFPGAHEPAMHKRGLTLAVRLEGRMLMADVSNVGAGHKVPTDARHRSYNVWVTLTDQRGNVRQRSVQMEDGEFRLYYRDDFKPSTQIAQGDSRTAKWQLPEGFRGSAHVRLTYALNPEELRFGNVTDVHESTVEIE